jgi:hypothetical protein
MMGALVAGVCGIARQDDVGAVHQASWWSLAASPGWLSSCWHSLAVH